MPFAFNILNNHCLILFCLTDFGNKSSLLATNTISLLLPTMSITSSIQLPEKSKISTTLTIRPSFLDKVFISL